MAEGYLAQLKLIVDNSIAGVYLIQDDKFWYVNPALARMFGYEPDEMITRLNLLDIVYPADINLVERKIQDRLEGKEEHSHYFFRGVKKDGTTIHCEVFGSRVDYRNKPAIIGIIIDVTRMRRAEESLQRSEYRYKKLIEASRDVIFSLSKEGKIDSLNSAFEVTTGWPRSQWIGSSFLNLVHPEDRTLADSLIGGAIKGVPVSAIDLRIQHKSGYGVYEFTGDPIIDNGEIIGILGVARDVTLRRETEAKLQWELLVNSVVSEIALKLLSSSSSRSFSLKDFGRELLDRAISITKSKYGFLSIIDPQAYEETRITFAGVSDEICATLIQGDEVAFSRETHGKYRGLWGHALNTGQPFFTNNPENHKMKLGVPRWHIPIKNLLAVPAVAGGEVLGQIVLANSHTGFTQQDLEAVKRLAQLYTLAVLRHREAEALKNSEERYRSLINDVVENSKVGMLILDPHFKVVWVNRTIEDFWKVNRNDIIGKDKRLLVKQKLKYFFEEPDRFADKILATYDNNTYVENFECHIIPDIGREERWLEHWSQPIESGLYAGGRVEYYHDITKRKTLERQLIQTQKMEAIGKLTSGIAHDFNNMISAIMGFTELSMDTMKEKSEIYNNLKHVRDAANRASDLVRKLLLFSRKQSSEKSPINLNDFIKDLSKVIQRVIGEDINVKLDLASTPCVIFADPGGIDQVVMNLVVNARDAMPEGGELTIKTEIVYVDDEYIQKHTHAREGNFICLSVADTGTGMTEDIAQRIFDPFFTTKHPEEGTGLGLSVVYGIVKDHRGWIDVESKLGIGSVFRIYFPFYTPRRESPQTISKETDQSSTAGSGERILLVEDDDHVRKFAKEALSRNGYTVLEAKNAKEALTIFEKEEGDFDLIFTDVVLPDKDGLQLVEDLKLIKPNPCVLFSSGYVDKKSKWNTIKNKGFEFLQKPYMMSDLLTTIRKVLESCKERKIKG